MPENVEYKISLVIEPLISPEFPSPQIVFRISSPFIVRLVNSLTISLWRVSLNDEHFYTESSVRFGRTFTFNDPFCTVH